MELFWKAFVAGFLIAAPVGAVGVLCIQRTLLSGLKSGLMTGLGAAVADTFYGAIAAFGVALITSFIDEHRSSFRLIGAIVIFVLGIVQLLKKPASAPQSVSAKTLSRDFISTFFITATNPITIFAFMAVFAANDIAGTSEGSFAIATIIIGVFFGALSCWGTITGITYRFRDKIQNKHYGVINRVGGILILCFGFYLLFDFIKDIA